MEKNYDHLLFFQSLGMFYENVIYCKRYEGSFSLNYLLDFRTLRCVNDSVLFSLRLRLHGASLNAALGRFLLLTRIFICLETITVKGLG